MSVLVVPDEGEMSRVRIMSIKLDTYYTFLLLDDPKPIVAHWVPSKENPPGNSFPCIGAERQCPKCGVFGKRIEYYAPVQQQMKSCDDRGETVYRWVEKVLHLPISGKDLFSGPEKVGHILRVTRRRKGNDWPFIIEKTKKSPFDCKPFDVYAAIEQFFGLSETAPTSTSQQDETAATIPFPPMTPSTTPPIPTSRRNASQGGAS